VLHPGGIYGSSKGLIWSARWEGARVLRIDPKGRIDRVVPMPAKRVTSVCFGGARLDTLYVTASRLHVWEDHIRRHPFRGGIFCFDPA